MKNMCMQLEEAEWVGLKIWEAIAKQKKIEQQRLLETIQPLKKQFAEETYDKLTSGEMNADARLSDLKDPNE